MDHEETWRRMWRELGVEDPDPALLPALLERYREPHRHYHSLKHLDACLAHLAALRGQAEHPAEIEAALWFHDAIYAIGGLDNEAQSAEWARSALLAAGVDAGAAQRVFAMVMATTHQALPQTLDETILIDVDLSILGAPEPHFDAYERQVRAEYAAVPDAQFRARRRGILQGFLDRGPIYRTAYFTARREAQARANLQRSIDRLGE